MYRQGSLHVREIHMNGQFEPMREPLSNPEILLNTTSASEHVLMIERPIRTIKDHVRSTIARTPFDKIPPKMTIECVKEVNMWLNSLPSRHQHPLRPTHESIAPRHTRPRQVRMTNRRGGRRNYDGRASQQCEEEGTVHHGSSGHEHRRDTTTVYRQPTTNSQPTFNSNQQQTTPSTPKTSVVLPAT